MPPAGSLTIVGTGYLVGGMVPLLARDAIAKAEKLFCSVGDPVTQRWLEELNPTTESLNDSYSADRPRAETYREMAERILREVRRGRRVCAAFYGHPGILVDPSWLALSMARDEGYAVRMIPGISAEDCLFVDLEIDPSTHGWQCFDATDYLVRRRRPDPDSILVLWQIGSIGVDVYLERPLWNRAGLGVLQEVLRESYPADQEVVLYEAAVLPIFEPRIDRIQLGNLETAEVTIATTLCVVPAERKERDPEMLARIQRPARYA